MAGRRSRQEQRREWNPITVRFENLSTPEWLDRVPDRFWRDRQHRLRYRDWLGSRVGYQQTSDWYALDQEVLIANGGKGLLEMFGHSPQRIVKDFFPEYDWLAWLFRETPDRFWQSRENRLACLHWLGERCGFRTFEDWQRLQLRHLMANSGFEVFSTIYEHDFSRLVQELFPDRECHPWMFTSLPPGYWNHKANRVAFVKWLGRHLDLHTNQDWYSLKPEHFDENGGRKLRPQYGGISSLVIEAFPNRNLRPWLFVRIPSGFWSTPAHRDQYFDWLAGQLGISELADWDGIPLSKLLKYEAHTLLKSVYSRNKKAFIRAAKRRYSKTRSR